MASQTNVRWRKGAAALAGPYLLLVFAAAPALGASFTATWLGGSDLWGNPAGWSTNPNVPNNGQPAVGDTYDVVVNSGTVTLDLSPTIEALTLDGSTTLATSAPGFDLTVQELFTWNATTAATQATLADAGTTFANGGIEMTGAGFKIIDDGRTVENAATANLRGGNFRIRDGSTFVNEGTFVADTDAGAGGTGAGLIISNFGSGPNAFQNQGTFEHSGIQTTTMSVPLHNTGLVDVQAGRLELGGGGTGTSGSYTVGAGSILQIQVGEQALDLGSTLSGAGTLRLGTSGNAGLSLASSTNSIATLDHDAGTLRGAGQLEVTDLFEWTGGIHREAGTTLSTGTLEITGTAFKRMDSSRLLENAGTTNFRGGNLRLDHTGTTFRNTGVFNADSNVTQGGTGADLFITRQFGAPVFENQGTFNQSGAQLTSVSTDFENTGLVDVETGTLRVGTSYVQTAGATRLSGGEIETAPQSVVLDIQGGRLEGISLVDANVDLGGTLAAGLAGAGLLPVEGSITFRGSGELEVELGGTAQGVDYDFVDASVDSAADVALDGALSVSFLGGFDALVTGSDVFVVLEAGDSLTGAFSNAASGGTVTTAEGHTFRVDYGLGSPFAANQVVLSAFQAVPEPGTGFLLGLGVLAMTGLGRPGAPRIGGRHGVP